MDNNQQNNSILEDTNTIPKVTEEMLQNFADPSARSKKACNTNLPENSQANLQPEINEDNNIEVNPEDVETIVNQKEYVNFRVKSKDEQKKKKVKTKKFNFSLAKFFVIIIILALLVSAVFGVWNRWFRYNDEQDIVSSWQINNSDASVKIDEKNIIINANANLKYTVDTFAKVINYEIGDMKGQSHYRFSWDRNQLALVENSNYDALSTILSDLGWFWDWSTCKMSKVDLSPAYTKNNKEHVDTENTGIEDIIENGRTESILLDKISTKKTDLA